MSTLTNWLILGGLALFLVAGDKQRSKPRAKRKRAARRRETPSLIDRVFGPELEEPKTRRNPGDMSPADRQQYEAALAISRDFHGSESQVVELDPDERRMPRFAVVAGELTEFTYAPNRGSERQKYDWEHRAGDRGMFAEPDTSKPLLAVDPITRRPILVQHRSKMVMESDKGFVG